MMTPKEVCGKVWRIMDTRLESSWKLKRRNDFVAYKLSWGNARGTVPLCEVEKAVHWSQPKGEQEAVRKDETPLPPFSGIRGVSYPWRKKYRMDGWDWGWKMILGWKKALNVGNLGSRERKNNISGLEKPLIPPLKPQLLEIYIILGWRLTQFFMESCLKCAFLWFFSNCLYINTFPRSSLLFLHSSNFNVVGMCMQR